MQINILQDPKVSESELLVPHGFLVVTKLLDLFLDHLCSEVVDQSGCKQGWMRRSWKLSLFSLHLLDAVGMYWLKYTMGKTGKRAIHTSSSLCAVAIRVRYAQRSAVTRRSRAE